MGSTGFMGLTFPDFFAIAFFILSWLAYHLAMERSSRNGLNRHMDGYRIRWMQEMARREQRMVDSSIMGSLQNGTAFFASTSLLAIGAGATLLRSGDDVLRIAADLPLGIVVTRGLWETKVIGLLVIFGYAFFKFAWAYRLFNYTAILIGATPAPSSPEAEERERMALRAGQMNIAAAQHFTRGQRAFFFALAYLGWFLGPWVFIATTAFILYVMWARQFTSGARGAVMAAPDANPDRDA